MNVLITEKYNRYEIEYCSECPLKGSFVFDRGGEKIKEEFYLEPSEHGVFGSFIEGYIDDLYAEGMYGLSFEKCADGEYLIKSVKTESAPILSGGTYFIENEYLKVGAELIWGGGLSYIEDKKCPVQGLKNMLNHADTGRLVQQSYYGTGEPPYVKGEFMGSPWVYNPVQGGDRGNKKSKLIDYRVTVDSIYVKCRPRDWGHVGLYTDSYMENEYSLDGEYLRVWNRFTDWSGYRHPVNSQEVPAFYTVSYLNNFFFYGGDKPWTGDTLEVRRDLIFWPEDWPRHRFYLKPGNTESWCAWCDDDDYGIGLYVPNVSRFIGGRFSYNGTKDPAAGPTNYVAPVAMIRLVSYEPISYGYLITAGDLCAIRSRFEDRKFFTDNPDLTSRSE